MVTSRRELIAEAAIALIDAEGAKGLTHRGVDAAAGLPTGTTSYYAPTRKDLLTMVVKRISEEPAFKPLEEDEPPRPANVAEAVPTMISEIERTAQAAPMLRARASILPELRRWPELAEELHSRAPISRATRPRAIALLEGIGVEASAADVHELMALCEALLMHRVTRPGDLNATNVLTRYLVGLGGRT